MDNMKRIAACGAAAAVMLSAAAPVSCEEGITMDKNEIIIDGASANLNENMRYRGAGMVSANNSSRLLLDYKTENPEAYSGVSPNMLRRSEEQISFALKINSSLCLRVIHPNLSTKGPVEIIE